MQVSQSFINHADTVNKRRKYWKGYHGKQEVKRRRAYKQDATEKKLLFENRTKEYESGIGLDIGHSKTQSDKPPKKRQKRMQCKCGSTTHLTTRSLQCPLNKKNLLSAKSSEEGKSMDAALNFEEKNI